MGWKQDIKGKRRVINAGAEAETQANPSFPNILEDVVVEILSRLPLRSLPRFTCVSKQWRSLIPDIIAKVTGKKMVLVRSILRSGTLTFHSIDEESRVEQVTTPLEKIEYKYYPAALYGSCNGLLLIGIEDNLFLWNPVTRYSKKVLSHESLADDSFIVGSSGLCHDSSTNEYKAVMGLYHESRDYGGEYVDVGSFRSKNWTRIRFPYKVHTMGSGPVINGHLHWYVSDENSGHFLSSHQILYFNPHTNQFSKVPMPEPKNRSDGNMILGLGVLEGCLTMVRHDSPSYYEINSVEVLAMQEYGMQNSWTKLFSISNLALMYYGKLEPLCYTKDGEALIMFTSISGQSVRAYDPIDSSYKEILVQPNCDSVHAAIMYEESLDTPTNYDWEEEEKRGEPAYVQYYYYSPPCKWIKKRNGWCMASLGD